MEKRERWERGVHAYRLTAKELAYIQNGVLVKKIYSYILRWLNERNVEVLEHLQWAP